MKTRNKYLTKRCLHDYLTDQNKCVLKPFGNVCGTNTVHLCNGILFHEGHFKTA